MKLVPARLATFLREPDARRNLRALSYSSVGVAAVLARLDERELSILGGGLDLISLTRPRRLVGQKLAVSATGVRTGLLVLAIQQDGLFRTIPPAATPLLAGVELVVLDGDEQCRRFEEVYG